MLLGKVIAITDADEFRGRVNAAEPQATYMIQINIDFNVARWQIDDYDGANSRQSNFPSAQPRDPDRVHEQASYQDAEFRMLSSTKMPKSHRATA